MLLADPGVRRVRSVARRPLPPHPKLVHVEADLRDPRARTALAGVDVLWHLGFGLWREGRESSAANLEGTSNVLAGRPHHVVLASSAAVYGAWPHNPLPLPETHPPRPNPECTYAQQKLEVERRCADTAPSALLRLGAVLGPGADLLVTEAVVGYRRVVPAIRGARQALQFLHEDDAAVALYRAGVKATTGVVNVAPDDWLTEDGIARVSGGRVVRVPRRLLIGFAEAAFRVGALGFGADRAVLLEGPLALDSRLAGQVLGWRAEQSSAAVLGGFLRLAGAVPDHSRWR